MAQHVIEWYRSCQRLIIALHGLLLSGDLLEFGDEVAVFAQLVRVGAERTLVGLGLRHDRVRTRGVSMALRASMVSWNAFVLRSALTSSSAAGVLILAMSRVLHACWRSMGESDAGTITKSAALMAMSRVGPCGGASMIAHSSGSDPAASWRSVAVGGQHVERQPGPPVCSAAEATGSRWTRTASYTTALPPLDTMTEAM